MNMKEVHSRAGAVRPDNALTEKYSEIDTAIRMIIKEIDDKELNILDVGCGTGRLGFLLKQENVNLHINGIDKDESALQIAQERGYFIQNIDLDTQELPYSTQSFDIVTCLDVLEHVRVPYAVLKEVNRVLKGDGLLILSSPNIQWIYHIIRLILGAGPKTHRNPRENEYDGGHMHYFTYNDIKGLFSTHGFEITDLKGSHNIHYRFLPQLSKLLFYLPIIRLYSCHSLVYQAKKVKHIVK